MRIYYINIYIERIKNKSIYPFYAQKYVCLPNCPLSCMTFSFDIVGNKSPSSAIPPERLIKGSVSAESKSRNLNKLTPTHTHTLSLSIYLSLSLYIYVYI